MGVAFDCRISRDSVEDVTWQDLEAGVESEGN